MKTPVITLWQPWAQFIMFGWKTIETRLHDKFKCLEGREILIHAGANWDTQWFRSASPFLTQEQLNLIDVMQKAEPSIICSAKVILYRRLVFADSKSALINCSYHRRGGLFLSEIKKLQPIFIKGSQGIWYYDKPKSL